MPSAFLHDVIAAFPADITLPCLSLHDYLQLPSL